jgi:hypothetical protein
MVGPRCARTAARTRSAALIFNRLFIATEVSALLLPEGPNVVVTPVDYRLVAQEIAGAGRRANTAKISQRSNHDPLALSDASRSGRAE